MKLSDTGIHHLTVGKIEKAGFHQIEELPGTEAELVKIAGIGKVTAKEILGIKARLSKAKGPMPPDELADEILAPSRSEDDVDAELAEEEAELYPTSRWSRYQMACICALDRHRGREMERWAYTYLSSLVNGTDRPTACKAAGREGVFKTDRAVEKEVLRMAENFMLTMSREYGPPVGSV